MSRSFNYCFIRRLVAHLRPKISLSFSQIHPNSYFSKGSKALLVSQICTTLIKNEVPVEVPKVDLDNGLRKACEEGDLALLKLMDQVKEVILIVSQEYRNCLFTQIEITKVASNAGPLSEAWDDLPEFRLLADELNQELNDYMALFNTIGQMSYDNSLVEFVTGNNNDLDSVIGNKYRELKVLLLNEIEENRKIEKELLKIKRDSILKDASYG